MAAEQRVDLPNIYELYVARGRKGLQQLKGSFETRNPDQLLSLVHIQISSYLEYKKYKNNKHIQILFSEVKEIIRRQKGGEFHLDSLALLEEVLKVVDKAIKEDKEGFFNKCPELYEGICIIIQKWFKKDESIIFIESTFSRPAEEQAERAVEVIQAAALRVAEEARNVRVEAKADKDAMQAKLQSAEQARQDYLQVVRSLELAKQNIALLEGVKGNLESELSRLRNGDAGSVMSQGSFGASSIVSRVAPRQQQSRLREDMKQVRGCSKESLLRAYEPAFQLRIMVRALEKMMRGQAAEQILEDIRTLESSYETLIDHLSLDKYKGLHSFEESGLSLARYAILQNTAETFSNVIYNLAEEDVARHKKESESHYCQDEKKFARSIANAVLHLYSQCCFVNKEGENPQSKYNVLKGLCGLNLSKVKKAVSTSAASSQKGKSGVSSQNGSDERASLQAPQGPATLFPVSPPRAPSSAVVVEQNEASNADIPPAAEASQESSAMVGM
jgi:hypothetical protein